MVRSSSPINDSFRKVVTFSSATSQLPTLIHSFFIIYSHFTPTFLLLLLSPRFGTIQFAIPSIFILLLLIYSTQLGTLSPYSSLLFSSLRGYPSPQIRSTPSIKPLIIDNNIWVSLLSCCIFQHVVSSLLNPFSFFLCPLLSKSQNKNKKNDDKQNAFSHLCLLVHLHPALFRRHFVQ